MISGDSPLLPKIPENCWLQPIRGYKFVVCCFGWMEGRPRERNKINPDRKLWESFQIKIIANRKRGNPPTFYIFVDFNSAKINCENLEKCHHRQNWPLRIRPKCSCHLLVAVSYAFIMLAFVPQSKVFFVGHHKMK